MKQHHLKEASYVYQHVRFKHLQHDVEMDCKPHKCIYEKLKTERCGKWE